jgi:stalled ribosome rescue protein Dom34
MNKGRKMKPKSYRRGYPVAVLVGIEQDHAALWQVFSQVAKHQQTIPLNGDRKDPKVLYNFHESIVNALRPTLKEGVRSIMIASPAKTNYAQEFQNHIKAHHSWLLQGENKATFSPIVGSASTPPQVAALTKTSVFKQLIQETASEETENLLEILEKRLNTADNLVLFSLEEAENLILGKQAAGKPQPEYLLLTDTYLSSSRQMNRLHRLMQIGVNNKVKTRVIDAESNAGKRLTQLGGIVCLAKIG